MNRPNVRTRLLGGSMLAASLFAAAAPIRAAAQDTGRGFQGSVTGGAGATTITLSPQTTTISVDSAVARIDWAPTEAGGAQYDFLPAGYSAIIQGGAPFTLLNRILPRQGRAIALNGNVISRIVSDTNSTPGGNVWFYSPGGIVIGGSAVFDVGGLLLSADAIGLNGNGLPDPNAVRFSGRPTSIAQIAIGAGARITAADSVALIAPSIVQSGTVRADGQIAYIAATRGTLTMPVAGGLFSIAVDVAGGTAATGRSIVHDGSTGGPASTSATDYHDIYMVTVAKNDAVTMLLGGDIGYDAAAGAQAFGDAVVLSAGRTITKGVIDQRSAALGRAAGIDIVNARLTSNTFADASGDIAITAQKGAVSAQNITAIADGDILASTSGVSTITADTVSLTSARANGRAGSVGLQANLGGAVSLAKLSLIADGDASARTATLPGTTLGGRVVLAALGGSVAVAGDTRLSVDGGATGHAGSVLLEVADQGQTLGRMRLGATMIDANGAHAGAIDILATSGSPTASLGLASLDAQALGAMRSGAHIAVTVGSGRIATAGDASFRTSGAVNFALSGASELSAGGNLIAVGTKIDATGILSAADIGLTATRNTVTIGAATATNGDISVAGRRGITADSAVTATGAITLTGGSIVAAGALRGANVSVMAVGSRQTIPDVTLAGVTALSGGIAISALHAVTLNGTVSAAGDLSVGGGTITATQALSGAGVALTSQRSLAVEAISAGSGGVDLRAPGVATLAGPVSTTGTLSVSAGTVRAADLLRANGVSIVAAGTAHTRGVAVLGRILAPLGSVTVSAARDVILGDRITAADSIAVDGNTIRADALLSAGRAIDLTSRDSLTVNAISGASAGVRLNALGRAILAGPITTGGDLDVVAASVSAAARLKGADVTISATGGDVAIADVTAAGDVAIDAPGDIALLGPIGAAGQITITGANIAANAAIRGAGLSLDSGGLLTLGTLAAGASGIDLTARGEAVLNGDITASGGQLRVDSAALSVAGALLADDISLTSSSVAIGDGAAIRTADASGTVSFTSTDLGPGAIGTDSLGYALSLDRVSAGDIAIVMPGDVTIGTVGLIGGQTLGANGQLTIQAGGSVRIVGGVTLTGASAGNGISISAGPAIDVVAPTGGIAILDTDNRPSGMVSLSAGRVSVATPGALGDILAATDLAARDARLAINDGVVDDAGLLVADTLNFAVTTGLYIQNTGASAAVADRRGFTAGAGGVTITTGPEPVEIAINGRQVAANGTITGDALIPLIMLTGLDNTAPAFDLASTVNGCRIVQVTCPVVVPPQPPRQFPGQVATIGIIRDTIRMISLPPTFPREGLLSPAERMLIELPLIGLPIIDDPVTGTGDVDNWDNGR